MFLNGVFTPTVEDKRPSMKHLMPRSLASRNAVLYEDSHSALRRSPLLTQRHLSLVPMTISFTLESTERAHSELTFCALVPSSVFYSRTSRSCWVWSEAL